MPAQVGDSFVKTLITAPGGDYVLYYDVPLSEPGEWVPRAVRSSDGRTWEEVETGLPALIDIDCIERGALGYLLLGNQVGLPGGNPTIWLSDDGISWERVHEFRQDTEWVQVTDAGAGDEGFVVLGQRIAADSSSYRRFAFASSDGREWIEATAPFGPDDPDYRPDMIVAGIGPDWIAASASRDDSARFWRSANGLDWQPGGTILDAGTAGTWDPVLAELDGRLYFSIAGNGFPDGFAGAWTSVDAATWDALDLGADAYLGGIAASDTTIVLTGTVIDDRTGLSVASVWVRSRH